MKQSLLTISFILLLSLTSKAAVLTVSNDPANGSQYSTLSAAYTAANTNDTLLIEGTTTIYADAPRPWAKKLVIIGTGYNPAKDNAKTTMLSGAGTVFDIASGGNGSKFFGIVFACSFQTASVTSDYYFENCKFNDAMNLHSPGNAINGLVMKNCVFVNNAHVPPVLSTNIVYISCVFTGYLYGAGNQSCSLGWVLVDHCLFLGGGTNLYSLFNAQINNSIFMNSSSITANDGGNNIFNNNIFRVATFNVPPAQSGFVNTGSNNYPSTNPNFVYCPNGSTYSPAHNYHLNAGSPAIAAASDGSDIGPHGSSTNFNESGEVLITPVIRSLNINNSIVAPNGSLNVHMNASKPTDN